MCGDSSSSRGGCCGGAASGATTVTTFEDGEVDRLGILTVEQKSIVGPTCGCVWVD